MDATAATFKAINVLASSITKRATNSVNLIPSRASTTRAELLALYAYSSSITGKVRNPKSRNNTSPFLTFCSTTPDVDSDNVTNKNSNPTVGSDSNSIANQLSTSPPNPIPSSSSNARGLVFDLGLKNSWDRQEISCPVVKRFLSDDEERWYMWYFGSSDGSSASDSIGLAVSSNGIHWERSSGPVRSSSDTGLVMNCSKDWWAFDTESIRPSEVVIMSSSKVRASSAVYWLYYTGFSSEKVEISVASKFPIENPERFHGVTHVLRSLPGLAISQDGRHWARIEGEHHSGALFDVGPGTEWDSLFVSSPNVVYHGSGDLRMYYHSFDEGSGGFVVGMARSRDGIRWVKLGKILGGGLDGSFDEFGIMNANVVKDRKDGEYVMAYEGVAADGRRSIGFAVSSDGLKDWRRCGDDPILRPSLEEDGWDNKSVGCPCLVQMDGDAQEWRLYYRGIGKGGSTGIGMAVSEGNGIRSFSRWTGFHI